ncbi:L-lactate dehydrogenase [Sphingomonas sp. URHD0057]|uniref:L-lactate dehydrogenase n=1 Tax=Sphingomonas sp. URHD0057 TaxID=1380389 RepID=UPI000AAB7DB8|nr:L-lactate dehydrogenase [Sphingomonas sp. URHD0057]
MTRKAASVTDYRALAKARLPHFLFEYVDGGSYDEVTLRRNVEDLRAIALRQRVLRDVSAIDLSAELLGKRWSMPVGLGPVGLSGLYARRGEVQAARAAAAANVPMVLSTVSACSLREVAACGHVPWYQLYFVKDRGFVSHLIARANEEGCSALFLTVDLAVPGSRYRDARAVGGRLRRAAEVLARPSWLWDVAIRGRPISFGNLEPIVGKSAPLADFQRWIHDNFDASVSWKDVAWVREQWKGPLVIKGVLDPDDAREALAHGADGIVVSNHGGRQLDGALSSARALPSVANSIGGKIPVLADGGVRSGLDVVRMLALGADFVLLGRAWAYALAGRGEAGVAHVLKLIEAEMQVAMALTGCASIAEIDEALIDRR